MQTTLLMNKKDVTLMAEQSLSKSPSQIVTTTLVLILIQMAVLVAVFVS